MKKKTKRLFLEEMASPQFVAPYQAAIDKVTGILEEYKISVKDADHQRIEMITSRVKTPQSAMEKLKRKGRDLTAETARRHLNDLAGIRVICCYYEDVYQVANMLLSRPELTLIKQKDFICSPKSSGYRSLHLIFEVEGLTLPAEEEIWQGMPKESTTEENWQGMPKESAAEEHWQGMPKEPAAEETQEKEEMQAGDPALLPGVRIEVQIRTLTMDAWARLDHELRYKKEIGEVGKIVKALRKCSDSIAEVDDKMQEILEWIRET